MVSISSTPRFQLTAGHVVLDFANTLDNRGRPNEKELLGGYRDLTAFAQQTGLISSAEAQFMVRAAERNPVPAERALRRARELREAVFAIFSGIATGHAIPPAALEQLNNVVREAGGNRVLARGEDHFHWQWLQKDEPLHWILWPIALGAAALLASDDMAKVRSCAAETCDWLFLDHSKNRSRRWCDMKVCGNRNKVRRFYRRVRV
ncbi:MAG TPA: CGNR zinc finger domain-containing protein [Terriglobales bacterium]|jgi:predicted RNA-binding Zn ribbon-like protein